MIALIALVIRVLIALVPSNTAPVMVIPPVPDYEPFVFVLPSCNDECWECYEADAYDEYADAFTQLFNELECKRAKNGALMIRRGNQGSFKFAKKG